MRLTQQQLETHLWGAANILRGKTAGQDYKNYILGLMFYKRLCDQWENETDEAIAEQERQQGRTFTEQQKSFFRAHGQHRFSIPEGSRWGDVLAASTNLGEVLTDAMRAVTADEVEKYKTARLSQFKTVRAKEGRRQTKSKIRPATVNRELACLRAMFNHVIKADVPVKNPISKTAAKTLQEHNEQTRVLTFDEQAKYLAKATPMLRDVATLMLETGMRPEEVYRIKPENVHLAEGFLFNPYGKTKAARRRIRLTATAKSILTRLTEECKDDKGQLGPYLFPHATKPNQPVPKVNSAHDRAVKDSKVAAFRLYDLRHTWATRAAEAGIDLVTLAAMLGHSKINMVLRYAHPTQEHQSRAMDKLEQFVAKQQIEAAARQQGMAEMPVQ
jgi:integrase